MLVHNTNVSNWDCGEKHLISEENASFGDMSHAEEYSTGVWPSLSWLVESFGTGSVQHCLDQKHFHENYVTKFSVWPELLKRKRKLSTRCGRGRGQDGQDEAQVGVFGSS